MHIDIFNNDAFSLTGLSKAINDLPKTPGRLAALGWFSEDPIATTSISVEKVGSALSLVPTAQRGSPGVAKGGDKRSLEQISVVHLPQRATILADEIQNLRAFGQESDLSLAQTVVNARLAKMRRDLDATIEWQRIGAVKGQVLDADGTTVLLDMFSKFGVTQQSLVMGLGTDSTKVKAKVTAAKRMVEDALGGTSHTSMRTLCSPAFFDALVSHPVVEKAYDRWMDGEFQRVDNRAGFFFGGVFWEEYAGKVGSQAFIADGEAYLAPEGVVDFFSTFFGPADYVEAANTLGLPYYAKQELLRMGKGVEIEAQSNPISICTRPRAVVKLTVS